MSWTYSGDPASSPADTVRFLIGDTEEVDQLVSDAEVAFAISQEHGNYGAAAHLAERLAAKFARDETFSVDGTTISGNRSKRFAELAVMLRHQAETRDTVPTPTVGPGAITGAIVVSGVRASQLRRRHIDSDAPVVADEFRRIGSTGYDSDHILSPDPWRYR